MASSTTPTPPLPTPPFIDIPGLPNLRDAGGYPVVPAASGPTTTTTTTTARMVRRGVLFRSSEPSQLTDAEAARLTGDLGIRTVYDLRSQTEIDRDTAAGKRRVREWPGAERVFSPVFLHEDYSPGAIALRFSSFAMGSEVRRRLVLNLLSSFLFSLHVLVWYEGPRAGRGESESAFLIGNGV